MRYFVIILFAACLSFSGTAPDNCGLKKVSDSLMGKSLSEAMAYLDITGNEFYSVQEPPMVLRGIKGKKGTLEFYIYVERTAIPIEIDTTGGGWKVKEGKSDLELIKDKKVIGFSLRCGENVLSGGETIFYYNFEQK